jgi:hypothetical protein
MTDTVNNHMCQFQHFVYRTLEVQILRMIIFRVKQNHSSLIRIDTVLLIKHHKVLHHFGILSRELQHTSLSWPHIQHMVRAYVQNTLPLFGIVTDRIESLFSKLYFDCIILHFFLRKIYTTIQMA